MEGRAVGAGRLSVCLAAAAFSTLHPSVKVRRAQVACFASRAESNIDFRQGLGEYAAATIGPGIKVLLVPCLRDNYAPIIHDLATGATAVIDTPEVEPILKALDAHGWKLTHVLNTHHHSDHTGGNRDLQARTGCLIIGPSGEEAKIPGINVAVKDGDTVQVGNLRADVLEVPGHTSGHIAFHFKDQNVAFVGDALFVLGCGRVFEGTAEQMWASLQKLRALPDDTVVYCAHEYTSSNARFAEHLHPTSELLERIAVINQLRSSNLATVPSLLGHEKATNPFLRADADEVCEAVGLAKGTPASKVFAEVRARKDRF